MKPSLRRAEVPTLDELLNDALLVAPPFTYDSIAKKPYHKLSAYERSGVFACTSIVWRQELISAAQQVEPPNVALIAAIGGSAYRKATDGRYRIDEISGPDASRKLSAHQTSEIARIEVEVEANQILSDAADAALAAVSGSQ
jgi:hypothetical protein